MTVALPCPCCPSVFLQHDWKKEYEACPPVPSLTASVADPEEGHTSPRTSPTQG